MKIITKVKFNIKTINYFSIQIYIFATRLKIIFFLHFTVDGELIMKCNTCHRWYHGECDSITSEEDADKCAEEKYDCPFCRPEDALPPHLIGNI